MVAEYVLVFQFPLLPLNQLLITNNIHKQYREKCSYGADQLDNVLLTGNG